MGEDMGSREFIEAEMRNRQVAPTPPALETVRQFLRSYCADADSIEEIRDEAGRAAAFNPQPLLQALRALELVIANPPSDGSLSLLVAIDGNRQLKDPSDAGAVEYLRTLAALLTKVLAT
jgi:hypothetical protein